MISSLVLSFKTKVLLHLTFDNKVKFEDRQKISTEIKTIKKKNPKNWNLPQTINGNTDTPLFQQHPGTIC